MLIFCTDNISVINTDNAVNYSDYIDDVWSVAFLYETNDESATVYMTGWDENAGALEWALHQISSTPGYKLLCSDWLCLPDEVYFEEISDIVFEDAYVIHQFQVAAQILDYSPGISHCIAHSVAPSK
jgi:hypothetical protein